MPRALTNDELALLRSDMQGTKLYLAVMKPNTIYTARLAAVPASNDNVDNITYTSGSGTLGNVKAGMTLYVGTSAGGYDLGMCRIRKSPISGTFYIGLTSEIDWEANAYLTVVDDFDLWAKHATISNETLRMDVDVAYSDQHTNFHPVPIMGPHAVVWLDEATVNVNFDASGSWVHGSTISGYAWSAPGSSASSGMTTATPTITYNAAGIYRVFLTVTAANGKTTTGVRHVFVYDRQNNPPSTVFQLAQCMGDYETGGWFFDITMQAEAGLDDIRDRALVVLFAEDWYGGVKRSIGPVANRENIVCVGRVLGESIRWDRENGLVHFVVQGLHHWLGKIKAFPVEIYFAKNTPNNWSVMPSMTVDRMLWHILYWHSTAIETMDFYPPNDTRFMDEGKSLASTIWGQLQDIAQSRILASPGVDRFGRLFVQVDPQMVPAASRTWETVMQLTSGDWEENIELRRLLVHDVSLITLTSQMVDASGAVSVLYSLSPGHAPRRYGDVEQADRLLSASQSQSNSLAGLMLGWRTNEFPEIGVSLAMNNRMIELYPRQFCALNITEADTPRGMAFDGNLIPRRITFYFDGERGAMRTDILFEAETFEQVSADGDVPDVDDLSVPPFPGLPAFPSIPPLYPNDPSSTPDGPAVVVIVTDTKGILYTTNFHETSPTWLFWNNGLPSNRLYSFGVRVDITMFAVPSGGYYIGMRGDGAPANYFEKIYYASSLGATWQVIVDQAWFNANIPSPTGNVNIMGLGFNPNKSNEVAFTIGDSDNYTMHFCIGNNTGFTRKVSFSRGNFFNNLRDVGSLSFGMNKWVWTIASTNGNSYYYRFNSDGSVLENVSNSLGFGVSRHSRAGTSATLVSAHTQATGTTDFVITTDNGQNFTSLDFNPIRFGECVVVAPDGMFMVGNWDNATGKRGKSSDGGYTWSGLPNLPAGGDYWFAYAGGLGTASRWIAARGVIRYSNNVFGAEQWQNKEGNITYLIPIGLVINYVFVPGLHNGG